MAKDDRRVWDHPILGPLPEADTVRFTFNGKGVEGRAGEMIAAALMAQGIRVLRRTERGGLPRGIYCAIGHCYDCRVTVNGVGGVRACLTPVRDGMVIES